MSNAVFPSLVGLCFPVERNPLWSTKVQTGVSGKETRLAFWSYPIWQYALNYDILRSDAAHTELQQLFDFYNARLGPYDTWLFNDPDDNTATAQQFGVGDGTTTVFQLARTLGVFYEPVKAVNTITNVQKAGVTTGAYTLDYNTGLITFTTAPAASAVLTWTGTYYWRCRFAEDMIKGSKFMNTFWDMQNLKFQSVK